MSPGVYCINDWKPGDGETVNRSKDQGHWCTRTGCERTDKHSHAEQPTSNPRHQSTRALTDCATWLSTCLRLGWHKDQIDLLESLWWKYHDDQGRLIERATDETPACVEWPHDWIDITAHGDPPTAMCTRCNERRPIVCAPDEPDALKARLAEAEGLLRDVREQVPTLPSILGHALRSFLAPRDPNWCPICTPKGLGYCQCDPASND